MKYHINGLLPGMNEYIKAINSNRHKGNQLKRETQDLILWQIKPHTPYEKPVFIEFLWIEQNKRRDKDNIASAKKFILDALQEIGILKGDGWKHIVGFKDDFKINTKHPGVEVTIKEVAK